MKGPKRSLLSRISVCMLCIAYWLLSGGWLVVVASETTSSGVRKFKLLTPSRAVQGESFSGIVLEETSAGARPISDSDKVTLQGVVIDHKDGEIKFPPVASIGAMAAAIAVSAAGGGGSQNCEVPVEIIPAEAASGPPSISSTSSVATPHSPFRVFGNKLNQLSGQTFTGERGDKVSAGPSVGSSVEQLFTAVPSNLPRGPLGFTATDGSGNQLAAPNAISNPHLRIAGPRIEQKGQRAQLTVQSDTTAQVFLSGGTPQITLDTNQVLAPANVPVKIGFTANEVGPYNVQALAVDKSDSCLLQEGHPKTQDRDREPEIAKRPETPGEEIDERKEKKPIPRSQERPRLPPVSIPGPPQSEPVNNPMPHTTQEEPVKLGILLTRIDDNWIPAKGSTTAVLAEIYRWDQKKEEWVKPGLPRHITFSFEKCSNEKGSCLNQGSETTPDLWFEQSSAGNTDMICSQDPSAKQKYFQKATTKQELLEKTARIWCDDYGAFSRVKASAPGCRDLVRYGDKGRLRTAERDEAQVTVPKDDNNNQIADAYINESHKNLNDYQLNVRADADDEQSPIGNGVPGDGLPAYEEYRGFFCCNRHTRTNWSDKDLFVHDVDKLGLGHYPERAVSALSCHIVNRNECTGGRTPVINFNRGHASLGFDQHALYLCDETLEDGLLGRTGGYGPPGRVAGIRVDRSKLIQYVPNSGFTKEEAAFDPSLKIDAKGNVWTIDVDDYELSMTITHELGHATGLPHHGLAFPQVIPVMIYPPSIPAPTDGNNLQYYADTLCTYALPKEFLLGKKMSPLSGDETCFMCYKIYSLRAIWINGNGFDCLIETNNVEASWNKFCTDKRGRFYNFGDRCAGSAVFGDCKSYLIVNDNPKFESKWINSDALFAIQDQAEANAKNR